MEVTGITEILRYPRYLRDIECVTLNMARSASNVVNGVNHSMYARGCGASTDHATGARKITRTHPTERSERVVVST